MNNEKRILKSINENDAVYEALYCAIVSNNDYIKELKENIKCCDTDIKNGCNVALSESQKETYKEQLKEYQEKRRLLKKAFKQLFGDSCEDYNA